MTEIEIHLLMRVIHHSEVIRKTFPKLNFPTPTVEFFVHPTKAGMAYLYENRIALNTAMAQANKDDFDYAIIHELSHLVTTKLFPYAKQAHGPEFKRVDRALGGRGCTIHSFDIESSIKASGAKRFAYTCGCEITHFLSTTRHNKMLRGKARYSCTKCDTDLSFSHQV